jgi:signal transduction histidine kinase
LHVRLSDKSHLPLLQIAILDITARKEAEQAVDQTNRLFEQRVRKRTSELQKSQRELQYIAENTIKLLERERRKISLDLHDTIAQGLVTIKLLLGNKLATMGRRESSQSPFSIEHILEIAGQNLNETRRIMNYLRPKMLDEIGFLATLRWHLQEFGRICPEKTVHKSIHVSESDLPVELTLVLYRIIQEATHNIARHSSADRVGISLHQKENLLKL